MRVEGDGDKGFEKQSTALPTELLPHFRATGRARTCDILVHVVPRAFAVISEKGRDGAR